MRPTDRLLGHITPEVGVVLLSCAAEVPRVSRDVLLVHGIGCVAEVGVHVVPEVLVAGATTVLVDPACDHDRDAFRARVEAWQQWCGDRVQWFDPDAQPHVWLAARPVDLGARAAARRAMLGRLDGAGDDRTNDERLRAALAELRPEGELPQESSAVQLAASGCTACGVCVKACPHDALVLVGEGSTELRHLPSSCQGEQDCVRLCPVDALTVAGHWPLTRVLDEGPEVLELVSTARCTVCGTRHPAAEGERCATCAYVKDRPFGSAMSVEEVLRLRRPPGG